MSAYGVTVVFVKLALRSVPPEIALVVTNTILVVAGLGLVFLRGESLTAHLSLARPTLYLGLAGLTLSIGIASYYIGLSRGPASVVVPIFALNFVVAGTLGILFLGEDFKATRILGILMAGGAVVLLTR